VSIAPSELVLENIVFMQLSSPMWVLRV